MGDIKRHRYPTRQGRGFTLIELLVVVAVLGVLSAIAVPNLREALLRARQMTAYSSVKRVQGALQLYMAEHDSPPATLELDTLEPLVSGGALDERHATQILSTFENDQIFWYFGTSGWWNDGGYFYLLAFRPKGDSPDAWCYLWDDVLYRWDPVDGWHRPLE